VHFDTHTQMCRRICVLTTSKLCTSRRRRRCVYMFAVRESSTAMAYRYCTIISSSRLRPPSVRSVVKTKTVIRQQLNLTNAIGIVSFETLWIVVEVCAVTALEGTTVLIPCISRKMKEAEIRQPWVVNGHNAHTPDSREACQAIAFYDNFTPEKSRPIKIEPLSIA